MEGQPFKKLVWQPRAKTVLRTFRIYGLTTTKQATLTDSSPFEKSIYAIILHGT